MLRDPRGHVDIDASGMLMDTAGEPDREIAWTIDGQLKPPLGHVYGYRIEPVPAESGAEVLVTSYYDWSDLDPSWQKISDRFPIVPESALKATLGILDRTIRRRRQG